MPFRDDIVGAETLIRSAIKSANFTDGSEEQVTGWRIARDGSATFNNLTIGSAEWTIDADGNAVFAEVSADSIVLDGESLADILNNTAKGVVNRTRLEGTFSNTTGASGATAGSVVFGRAIVPNVGLRTYEFEVDSIRIDMNGSSATYIGILVRIAFDEETTTSNGTFLGRHRVIRGDNNSDGWFGITDHLTIDEADVGKDLHIGFYVEANTSGVRAQIDNATEHHIVVKDIGPATEVQVFDLDDTGEPGSQHVTTYDATWSATWDVSTGKRSGDEVYQGDYSGGNNRYGKVGFDDAQIRSDLSGATIDKIEIRFKNEHTWFNDGWTVSQARIGTHNHASEPTGSSSTSGSFGRSLHSWGKGQTKYVTLPNAIGEELRDNTTKGLTLGRTSGGTQGEYGWMTGADGSSSTKPRLRITYTK